MLDACADADDLQWLDDFAFDESSDLLFTPPLAFFDESRHGGVLPRPAFVVDTGSTRDEIRNESQAVLSEISEQGSPTPRQKKTDTAGKASARLEKKAEQNRRAYQRYRERQRLQKEDDKRTIEALNARLAALEVERADLAQRVEVLSKINVVRQGSELRTDKRALRDTSELTLGPEVAKHYATALNLLRGPGSAMIDSESLVGSDVHAVHQLSEECNRAVMELLVRGEDPESEDGRLLVEVEAELDTLGMALWALQPALNLHVGDAARTTRSPTPGEVYGRVLHAMKLSKLQKRVLVEERLRQLAESAERTRQRAPLLQLLAPQLLQDNGTNMERIFAASQAATSLQANLAAESAALVDMHKVYSATVTAHQAVRGKLAAWPYYIQVIPLMKYLEGELQTNVADAAG